MAWTQWDRRGLQRCIPPKEHDQMASTYPRHIVLWLAGSNARAPGLRREGRAMASALKGWFGLVVDLSEELISPFDEAAIAKAGKDKFN